jgi:hypothetical protein
MRVVDFKVATVVFRLEFDDRVAVQMDVVVS